MNQNDETTATANENRTMDPADPSKPLVLHKPPSMLWFIIPLGILMLYGVLTR